MDKNVEELKELGYTVIHTNNIEYQNLLLDEVEEQIKLNNLKWNDQFKIGIKDELINCKNVIPLFTNSILINLVQDYYGSQPVILGGNLRKSHVHGLAPEGTELFHRDRESLILLKAFWYLHDVDMNAGPFTYVEASFNKEQKKNIEGYGVKKRYTDEEIVRLYGKDKIKYLTAKCGDIIIANTTGFHKGLVCTENPRYMITATFNPTPPTYNSSYQMLQSDFNKLNNKDQKLFKYVVKI